MAEIKGFKYVGLTEGHLKGPHGCTPACLQPIGTKRWICLGCGKEVFGDKPECRCGHNSDDQLSRV